MTLPVPSHLKVRDARDQLIDLLGIGQTYPLRDVDVQAEQLTVTFNDAPVVDIQPGQTGVKYELYDQNQVAAVGAPYLASGTGDKTVLTGPKITKDTTFSILATKLAHPEQRTFLWQSALFKIGLNNQLRAFTPTALTTLNPNIVSPADAETRIVDWGSKVTIQVVGSQVGAQYSLGYTDGDGKPVATSPVTGTGGDIPLFTNPLSEDAQVSINVSRKFAPAEGRTDLSAVLSTVITLAVRANPRLAVTLPASSFDGSQLVDPLAPVMLLIMASQKSVTYSAYVRRLLDADFEFQDPSKTPLIPVAVPASVDVPTHLVYVRAPTLTAPLAGQADYVRQGDISAGNGATLTLNLSQLHDDSIVFVQAKKTHKDTTGKLWESAVQLMQPAVVLPRPDPASALTLAVSTGTGGAVTMLVTNGQRGVFYHFRMTPGSAEIGAPAYFHRLDEVDAQQNHGAEQLRIEADFVVTRPPPAPGTDLARQLPLLPLIDLAQVPAGTTLSVTAVWARTGVAWTAARPFPMNKT